MYYLLFLFNSINSIHHYMYLHVSNCVFIHVPVMNIAEILLTGLLTTINQCTGEWKGNLCVRN